jgi:hypothetical protein
MILINNISLAQKQVNDRETDVFLYLRNHVYKDSGYDYSLKREHITEFAACSTENDITKLSKSG